MKLLEHCLKSIDNILDSLEHGETLQKFIAVDKGSGDFNVEIHGLVTEEGKMIIYSEKIDRRPKDKAPSPAKDSK